MGKVFVIFSIKEDQNKKIFNKDIVNEMKKEVQRLEKSYILTA